MIQFGPKRKNEPVTEKRKDGGKNPNRDAACDRSVPKRKKADSTYDFLETLVLSTGTILLALSTIIVAKLFIPWFFENKYDDSLSILTVLIFSGAFSAIHRFSENYFFVEDKTKYLARVSLIKLGVLLVSALILMPIYSIVGLAISQFIASLLGMAIVLTLILSKKY